MNKNHKTFLLGIGAQRSGTTWLHHYLSSHPSVKLGFAKEYHIFDRLYVNDAEFKTPLSERLIGKIKSLKGTTNKRVRFLSNPQEYFSYFNSLLSEEHKASLTGDLTPSYAGLSIEGFRFIKENFDKYGFNTKVIFLMRDPIDRCVSAARMDLRNCNKGNTWSPADENALLYMKYKSRQYEIRTRYDRTINNVESVFEAEELFYGFYEEFFNYEKIRELCNFLGISFIEPDFTAEFNVSRTTNFISVQLIDEIRTFYQPVYKFVGNKFGDVKIKKLWVNHPENYL